MIDRFFSSSNRPFVATLALVSLVSNPVALVAFSPVPLGAIAATPAPTIDFEPPAALPPTPVLNDPDSRKKGGASRGCNQTSSTTQKSLFTVLSPTTPTDNQKISWGLTTADQPTFWLHTHQGLKDGALVVMTLQGINHVSTQKVEFQVPPTAPGVLRFTPPATTTPLVAGSTYRWKLEIYCHSGTTANIDPSLDNPEIIRGGILRLVISPDLQRQLATSKTPLERARLYAKNGIWYDSLTTLGLQLQGKTTVDPAIARAWADLLRQGNLETNTTLPIQPCCTPK